MPVTAGRPATGIALNQQVEQGVSGAAGAYRVAGSTVARGAVLDVLLVGRGVPPAPTGDLVILHAGFGDDLRDETTNDPITQVLQRFYHAIPFQEGGELAKEYIRVRAAARDLRMHFCPELDADGEVQFWTAVRH